MTCGVRIWSPLFDQGPPYGELGGYDVQRRRLLSILDQEIVTERRVSAEA